MGLTPQEEDIMVRQNAMETGQSSSPFETRPTDGELQAHIDMKTDAVLHGEMTFIHLTPNRTRVIFETWHDQELDDMARLVANADALAVAEMQRLEREKAEGKT